MTIVLKPLPFSATPSSQAPSNKDSVRDCGCGTRSGLTSCRSRSTVPKFRSSFLVEWISPSEIQGFRKPANFSQLARIISAVGRRHHRRREDFDAYVRSKEKPQQGPGKVQVKNNRRDGGDDKVVITLDMEEFKHRAADAVVVFQKAAERSMVGVKRAAERSMESVAGFAKDVALEGSEAWRELRSSVRVQRDKHYVISIKRSSLEFAGKAVVGSVLLVIFAKLFLRAMRDYRWGWEEGLRGSRVVRDRSLGGKEVTLNKGVRLWEGGPVQKAVNVPRTARGPLDLPVEDSRSEKELQKIAKARGQNVPAAKKAPRLPGWWPEPDLPPSSPLSTRQRAEEEASRLVHGIMQKRLVGSDFLADDIMQLRQLCRLAGTTVKFDTYNTRDSFYRAAVNTVLSACQRAGKWSMADFGSEGGARFIAGLAANIGLESDRAATIVNAAVAARTRAGLLQARALHMQSKTTESEEELLKLIRLHSCFPPDPDSAEMEMVARGLGSHFDREGRIQMLHMYENLGGAETKRVAGEALGLLLAD
ncbi:unnamed protein product [Calypogeia fissa]